MALITLLPKCENASSVKDFRHIACCSVLYKIISKVLANRMKKVLTTIISENQSAFVPGRVIFDNILLSHELIKGYGMAHISPRCRLKWTYRRRMTLLSGHFCKMLKELGFPPRYIQWIMACLSNVTYTVNVNGELTDHFESRKGLRQGDPISSYLFVICMEYLNRCLKGLQNNERFHYHPRLGCYRYIRNVIGWDGRNIILIYNIYNIHHIHFACT